MKALKLKDTLSLPVWVWLIVCCKQQCGIKCLMGCGHKIKTKMVCENIMPYRTLRGDKIHNPLSDSSPF